MNYVVKVFAGIADFAGEFRLRNATSLHQLFYFARMRPSPEHFLLDFLGALYYNCRVVTLHIYYIPPRVEVKYYFNK